MQLRRARGALSTTAVAAASRAATARLAHCEEFLRARRIAGYVAVGNELDPRAALVKAHDEGKSIYLPCIRPDRQLIFARWRPGDTLDTHRFGIPEPDAEGETIAPEALDFVIVPLLGFDLLGHRLGNGGGYYDCNFAFRINRPDLSPTLVGFAHALQVCPELAVENWDVSLDFVVTDQATHTFHSTP